MTDTSSVGSSRTPDTPYSPPARSSDPAAASRNDRPSDDPRAGAFQAAMREARENRDDDRGDSDDDASARGGRKKGKGGLADSLASLLGVKGSTGAHGFAPGRREGLRPIQGGQQPAGRAGGLVHVDGSAASSRRHAGKRQRINGGRGRLRRHAGAGRRARAQAGDSQTIRVSLNAAGSPVQGFQLARGPDGALTVALAAAPGSVAEVTRSLESLRRRMEAKGFSLDDLRLSTDLEEFGPVAGQAASGEA